MSSVLMDIYIERREPSRVSSLTSDCLAGVA